MNNKGKKILAIFAAATMLTAAFAGCKDSKYAGDALDYKAGGEVTSNGGFVVEEGDYVYFINGQEAYTANNEYGEVVKGALMRINKSDLSAGDYSKVKTVVPSLFVAQNFDAGVYIYDGYVYYATPTTDKNLSGQVENSWLDFKRAKLDGTAAPEDYFFRLSSNSSKYRFVKEGKTVYCLFEEDGALKSYNVSSKKTTTLVKNAKSSFYYDTSDAENPVVYYTMSVVSDAETDNASTASYDQLYCVSASATVTSLNSAAAKYTTSNGNTYDFNEAEMKADNAEAKEAKQDEPYNFSDYTTYPYVNLGKLVLDGVGSSAAIKETQFNAAGKENASTPDGYNYTITSHQNGGVYFTRTEVVKTSSEGENTKLYYLADKSGASEWNAITGNEAVETVAMNTTNTGSAIFYIDEGKHYYLYLDSEEIKKTTLDESGKEVTVGFKTLASGSTLWQIRGDYLYFYASAENGNGNGLSRINYKGSQEDYDLASAFESDEKSEYRVLTFAGVDWNSSWYKPEFVGDQLVYSNEQSFGTQSYGYIYTTAVPATQADLEKVNDAYDKVWDEIEEYADDDDMQAAMEYYFRTGERKLFDEAYANELYDDNQKKSFDDFVAKFAATDDTKLAFEKTFIQRLSKVTSADASSIAQAWADSLPQLPTNETVEDEFPWVWVIIGGVLVVAAAVLVLLLVIRAKKKAKAKEDEATVNAYKRKIDTTDDKSIDVYADETTETAEESTETAPVEQESEAAAEAEETANEAVETPVEEATEAPAEEAEQEEAPAEAKEEAPKAE